MRKTAFFVLVFSLLSISSYAQIRNIPSEVEQAFKAQYPAADSVKYEDLLIGVKVHFLLNGERLKASYNNKGHWNETEKDWNFENLSDEVKDGFQKSKYADWKMIETKVLYRPDGQERFKIKIIKNDILKRNLVFNDKGRLLDDMLTL